MTAQLIKLTSTLALTALTLVACTTVPTQLQGEYPEISPARVEPSVYGSNVRWGGIIIDTRNEENRTCFEVLSRDLSKYMRPKLDDNTSGRFLACKPGFYDPEVFSKGRELTLTGSIQTIEEHPIDDFNYRYPVLEVSQLVLWEKRKDIIVYDNYGPFYSPYAWGLGYPYYRYPYLRSPYYGYPRYGHSGFPGRTHVYMRQSTPGPANISVRER
jgi:outer membrane lipoprotein